MVSNWANETAGQQTLAFAASEISQDSHFCEDSELSRHRGRPISITSTLTVVAIVAIVTTVTPPICWPNAMETESECRTCERAAVEYCCSALRPALSPAPKTRRRCRRQSFESLGTCRANCDRRHQPRPTGHEFQSGRYGDWLTRPSLCPETRYQETRFQEPRSRPE